MSEKTADELEMAEVIKAFQPRMAIQFHAVEKQASADEIDRVAASIDIHMIWTQNTKTLYDTAKKILYIK